MGNFESSSGGGAQGSSVNTGNNESGIGSEGESNIPEESKPLEGFSLVGDPESANGATWTYKYLDPQTGIQYDLKGNLFKPPGEAIFPGMILSHGYGGAPATNNSSEWRSWGLVVIGVQYTHARGDTGLPTGGDGGASDANILRARKCLEILASLGYVDMKRVAAHGHSMGAMLTAALVGEFPSDFLVASHTAGGVNEDGSEVAATSSLQADGIRVPYQIHHGVLDTVVPLEFDRVLQSILIKNGVSNEIYEYPDLDHPGIKMNSTMYSRVKAWYTQHGLFSK